MKINLLKELSKEILPNRKNRQDRLRQRMLKFRKKVKHNDNNNN